MLLDIFCPSTVRNPLCTQYLARGFPVTASAWAISSASGFNPDPRIRPIDGLCRVRAEINCAAWSISVRPMNSSCLIELSSHQAPVSETHACERALGSARIIDDGYSQKVTPCGRANSRKSDLTSWKATASFSAGTRLPSARPACAIRPARRSWRERRAGGRGHASQSARPCPTPLFGSAFLF